MAAPVYNNDLITIALGDLNYDAGVWSESGDAGWDTAGAMVDDENLQYTENSTNSGEAVDSCTSQQYTKDGNGAGAAGPGTIMYTHTAPFTVPTDGVVLIDNLWAAPSALNPYAGTFLTAEAGVSVLIGDDADNFDVHYVSGSDKPPAPEGGWATYAVDPTITPAGTVGTVTNTTTVGCAIAAVAQARGNPHACQSVRYGRAEVEYTVGDATTPATFDGYAAIDNAAADRFNLLKIIKGGYEARGLMTFGTATTAVHFDDSDKSIVIADDLKVGSTFNKGIVNNASSIVNWTNISITNQSAVSKYTFTVNDAAETNQTGCVFTDVGAFTYGANSLQTNVTYRRQDLVTQGSSTFTGCTFDNSVGAISLSADDISLVTDCTFTSDDSNHAVDLGTVSTTQTMDWNNYLTNYATADGSTGNEAILVSVDTGITLTISVGAGYTTPYIYNTGLGTVIVVSGQATYTQTVIDKDTSVGIEGVAVTVLVKDGTGPYPYQETVTITSTAGTATVAHTAHGMLAGHKVSIAGANENEYNRIKTILTVPTVNSYTYAVDGTPASPATGTIISTAIIIDGLTDASGQIADTRGYGGTNQPITGTAKKGSGAPVYKSTPITGTIDSANGLSITTAMTKD